MKRVNGGFGMKHFLAGAALAAAVAGAGSAVLAQDFETGPNISGESSASDRRQLLQDERPVRMDDNMRIEVPRGPNGFPQRPVRGLSRTEEMEMDDLEHRFQQGQIGEAEYYSRRNALMERIGLEAEY